MEVERVVSQRMRDRDVSDMRLQRIQRQWQRILDANYRPIPYDGKLRVIDVHMLEQYRKRALTHNIHAP